MTRTASPKRAPAIPALMPLPKAGSKAFWPIAALNDDAKLQAIEALQGREYKKPNSCAVFTTRLALNTAHSFANFEVLRSFGECRSRGTLMLAWRGSKALLPNLPASQEGGAA